MYKGFLQFLQACFIILDLLILNIAYLFSQNTFPETVESQYYLRFQQFFIFINAFWLLSTWIYRIYSKRYIASFDGFLSRTLKVFIFWTIVTIIYLLLPRRVDLSPGLVYSTISLFFIGLIVNRYVYLALKEWLHRQVNIKRKVMIIGYNKLARKLANYLDKDAFGIKIMGYIDDDPHEDVEPNFPLFSNIDITLKLAKQLRVNEVYSTVMPEKDTKLYNLMKEADKELIRFRVVPDFSHLINKPVHIDYLRDLPVFSTRREPLEDVINRVIKRTFDIVVSLGVSIFILSWLIPLLGLLIKMESPGPIFFVQLRSGLNNKPFRCFKFRSMGINKDLEAVQATKNDMRVTRIGRIIRKTSLDEFPQFLNVLMGEMSIVGPRPHMLKHTKDFSSLEDDYMIRQFLKPGISGWAQVNGFRGEIKDQYYIKKRVEYDLWYLEHWSLSLDLKIMFLTVYNAVKGEENAY